MSSTALPFSTTEQFYDCLQQLFDTLQRERPQATQKIKRSKLSICFRCTDPDGIIWIDGSRDPLVRFGEAPKRVNLLFDLSATTLHQILLGRLSVGQALRTNAVKIKGSKLKALQLADLFSQLQAYYPVIIAQRSSSS